MLKPSTSKGKKNKSWFVYIIDVFMYVWLGGCVCFEMLFKPLVLRIWWSYEMVNHKWCHLSAHTGHTCWHNTEQTTYHICRHNTEWTLTYHTYWHDTERTMIDHNYQNDTGWGEAESLPSRTEPHPLDVVPCWTHWWRYLSTYGRVLSAVMMIFQTNRFFDVKRWCHYLNRCYGQLLGCPYSF